MKAQRYVFVLILSILPVLAFLWYSFSTSGTLFRADDFHLLKTVVWIQETNDLFEKIRLLIQQHNEHRIIIPRLLTLLDYHIEGWINWRTLVLIGNILWVSVLWFFWKAFEMKKIPVWMFIPLPYILFQPQYFENVNWAISVLQQSVIIFWFCLFSYLFVKKRFAWAMFVGVLATFTHGNGIFSFAIGIILFALDRNWKDFARWVLALALIGVIYFWGFVKGQNANFHESFSDPVRLIMSFFAFLGSLTTVQFTNLNLAVLLGAVFVLILGGYLLPKISGYLQGKMSMALFDRFLLTNVLFLAVTAALVCVSRSWAGLGNIIAPRYQHYSPFVACWVYVVILVILAGNTRRIVAGLTIVLALAFNFKCYLAYDQEVVYRQNWLVADASNWVNHGVFLNYAESFNRNIKETYERAVAEGICRNDNYFDLNPDAEPNVDSSLNLSFSERRIIEKDATNSYPRDYIKISNEHIAGPTYLYLKAKGTKGYWLATIAQRNDVRVLLSTHERNKPGFATEVLTENIHPGRYRIGVLNNNKFAWTAGTVLVGKRTD